MLRVEDLEHRRGRVASKVAPELVDLVEHEHGVIDLAAPERLEDSSRQSTNVGTAMAPKLSLVVKPAETHPLELAILRSRNRFAERRLTHAGRSDEEQDGRFRVGVELLDREVL